MSVLGLIISFPPYQISAMVRFSLPHSMFNFISKSGILD